MKIADIDIQIQETRKKYCTCFNLYFIMSNKKLIEIRLVPSILVFIRKHRVKNSSRPTIHYVDLNGRRIPKVNSYRSMNRKSQIAAFGFAIIVLRACIAIQSPAYRPRLQQYTHTHSQQKAYYTRGSRIRHIYGRDTHVPCEPYNGGLSDHAIYTNQTCYSSIYIHIYTPSRNL